jgi:DNA-binding MarR family transcriptional regulator
MTNERELGALVEAFVNRVSHPRGRVLNFMAKASITVPQAILLSFALEIPESTPSSLAASMKISLPSVSQMIERLVKLGLAHRMEDPDDRRRRTINVTSKGRRLLTRLESVRSGEYSAGAAGLSEATRRLLIDALSQALRELSPPSEGKRARV